MSEDEHRVGQVVRAVAVGVTENEALPEFLAREGERAHVRAVAGRAYARRKRREPVVAGRRIDEERIGADIALTFDRDAVGVGKRHRELGIE